MTSMDQVKYEITADRAQIRNAARELREQVSEKTQRAREAVDPRTYAREYPWIALGLIVGAGFALGYSGADRKAAAGMVDGARKAGEALADSTIAAKDAVVERFSGNEEGPLTAPVRDPKPGIVGSRLGGAVQELLQQGLDEIMEDLR